MNIWDEIIEEAKLRSSVKLEDEMTLKEFASTTGMTVYGARNYLAKLCKEEKMTKRWVYHDGSTRLAYKPTEA